MKVCCTIEKVAGTERKKEERIELEVEIDYEKRCEMKFMLN